MDVLRVDVRYTLFRWKVHDRLFTHANTISHLLPFVIGLANNATLLSRPSIVATLDCFLGFLYVFFCFSLFPFICVFFFGFFVSFFGFHRFTLGFFIFLRSFFQHMFRSFIHIVHSLYTPRTCLRSFKCGIGIFKYMF